MTLATSIPAVGHEWYYVDPAKRHAVVRVELFSLPPESPSDSNAARTRATIRMDNFQQTKQGFWYPAVIHTTMPVYTIMPGGGEINLRQDPGAIRQMKATIRYHFDFAADLLDSLFTVGETRAPEKQGAERVLCGWSGEAPHQPIRLGSLAPAMLARSDGVRSRAWRR